MSFKSFSRAAAFFHSSRVSNLTKGTLFILEGQPYEVLEMNFLRMQQRKATVNTKIRNLITGKILERNWQASDSFEEAEMEKTKSRFLYGNRGVYWFDEVGNPQNRFSFKDEELGEEITKFLKSNLEVIALKFNGKFINIELPIKVDFKVVEAPPSIRGDTAQGGNKLATVETGAKILVPLFINEGDKIKVNTETGAYMSRAD